MFGCSATRLGDQEKAGNLRKQVITTEVRPLLRHKTYPHLLTTNLVREIAFIQTELLTDESETRFVLRRDLFPWIIQINYSHFKQLENKGLQSTVIWYRESGPVAVLCWSRWFRKRGEGTNDKQKVLRVRLCLLVFPCRSSAASHVWKNTFSLKSFTQRETRSCSSRIFTELSASAKAELSAVTLNGNCVPAGFLFFISLYNKNTVEWWLVVSEICSYFCCLCTVV